MLWLSAILRSVFSAKPKTVFQTSDKSFGTILLLAHATKTRPYKLLCELTTCRGEHCSPAKFHITRCFIDTQYPPAEPGDIYFTSYKNIFYLSSSIYLLHSKHCLDSGVYDPGGVSCICNTPHRLPLPNTSCRLLTASSSAMQT